MTLDKQESLCFLSDNYEPTLEPILYGKPLFSLANGIYSPLERLYLNHQESKNQVIGIEGSRKSTFYQNYINKNFTLEKPKDNSEQYTPLDLISSFNKYLQKDTLSLSKNLYLNFHPNIILESPQHTLYIHKMAQVSHHIIADLSDGPIILDKNVIIQPFTFLKGPLYIGENTYISSHSKIAHARLGKYCKIGGEVSHSFIGNFSNKVHEGFLGHSIIGDWVNIGALTTTSNLKNNYSYITLVYQNQLYPTHTIKLGSIIGDFVKIAIGTMLNTGTIIDVGSLIFKGRIEQKYYPPFFWGGQHAEIYRWDKFLLDNKKILLRREQHLTNFYEKLLYEVYLKFKKY